MIMLPVPFVLPKAPCIKASQKQHLILTNPPAVLRLKLALWHTPRNDQLVLRRLSFNAKLNKVVETCCMTCCCVLATGVQDFARFIKSNVCDWPGMASTQHPQLSQIPSIALYSSLENSFCNLPSDSDRALQHNIMFLL